MAKKENYDELYPDEEVKPLGTEVFANPKEEIPKKVIKKQPTQKELILTKIQGTLNLIDRGRTHREIRAKVIEIKELIEKL